MQVMLSTWFGLAALGTVGPIVFALWRLGLNTACMSRVARIIVAALRYRDASPSER